MKNQNFKNKIFFILIATMLFLSFSVVNAEEETPINEKEISIEQNIVIEPEEHAEDEPAVEETEENSPSPEPIVENVTTTQYFVTVNYLGENIFSNTINPTSTWFVDANGQLYQNEKITALGALAEASRQANFSLEIQNFGWGYYVSAISGNYPTGFDGWVYNVNQIDPGWTGINDYILQENDNLSVFYSVWPWKIEANTATATVNSPITFTTFQYSDNSWQTAPSTTIIINSEKLITNEEGKYVFAANTTGTISAYIFGTADWPQNSPSITVEILEEQNVSTQPLEEETEPPTTVGGGGGTNQVPTYNNLDIQKAIQYLNSNQTNGNFNSTLYTDWAAIAFGAYNKNHPTAILIKDYLLTDPDPTAGFNPVSDYARRAMALMSLGINPYTDTPTNYIKKIVDSFDENQIGDPNLFNDDIFSLVVLNKAGYSETDEILQKTIDFILSKQTNGNWGDLDLTAAAVQALNPFYSRPNVNTSVDQALAYLKSQQQTDGNFNNNSFSSSWIIQAASARGLSEEEWVKKTQDYLAKKQTENGSITENVWATTQAIPAALNKDWPSILMSFGKINPSPEQIISESIDNSTNNDVTTIATITTIATSTTSTTSTDELIEIIKEENEGSNEIQEQIKTENIIIEKTEIMNTKFIHTAQVIGKKPSQEITNEPILLSAAEEKTYNTEWIEQLPIDTAHKKTAKKILAISGGSSIILGIYLGLRLIKNVI